MTALTELRDRVFVWLLTGPLGRLYALIADLAIYWWRWARSRIAAAGSHRG